MIEPFILILFEVLFLSTNPHKEDRFLMKLLPFMLIYIGIALANLKDTQPTRNKTFKKRRNILVFMFLFGNWSYFLYSSLIDKRGAIDSMNYLRSHSDSVDKLLMLTECHRTPFYSYIHRYFWSVDLQCRRNISMDFPKCSPYELSPIHDSKLLFINPSFALDTHEKRFNPSHLLVYSQFLNDKKFTAMLEVLGYKEVKHLDDS